MITDNLAERVDAWLMKDMHLTFYERIEELMRSEPLYKDLPYAERYGKTLRHILAHISVPVQPGERIVGSVKEIIPDPGQVAYVEELSRLWWDKPIEDIQKENPFWYSRSWLRRRPPWFYSFGHLGLIWPDLLDSGLGGLRQRARSAMENLGRDAPDDKRSFLKGAIECHDAISAFIERYAVSVEQYAERSPDSEERREMSLLADSLHRIAVGPAGSFRDALQLLWLVTLVIQKVCGCGVLNFSRMDQYLLPFYEKGIADGSLNDDLAMQLLREFFFKNNEIMAPADHMSLDSEGTRFTLEVTFDDPNYITVGGLLPDGRSGVNALSRLMVKAAHSLRLRNPFMIVRHHNGIDEEFMLSVCDAIRDNATLVVYNDETMIPAILAAGVEKGDACNYGFFGCNDPDIAGENGGLRQLWWNLAKPLELALNRGDYPMQPRGSEAEKDCQFTTGDRMIGLMTGPYYGIETSDLDDVGSMEEFIELYRAQSMYLMEEYRRGFEQDVAMEKRLFKGHLRIEDCFLHGTVENAVTWPLGGTKYHFIITQGTGLATVVDSLYAIEEIVFRNREMGLKEFAAVLASNWSGHESLRKRVAGKMAKFGNDIPEVDKYAETVVNIFCDCVDAVNSPEYLYRLIPTLSSDRDFTTMGKYVGATPDGRTHGAQLSENQSPTENKDVSGLTALFNSLAHVPFRRIAGGPLNVKIHPGAVAGDSGLKNFYALVKTYFEDGGMQIQANILDRRQLVEAKENPDKHRNLCIRVTGYSAFFVQMGEKAQEELIARTEQM